MDSDATVPPPTHHLVIAGTGRAGTSFLVRYLTELGLDTTLSRRGEAAGWNETANAGLEEMPITGDGAHFPYVVKSPWTGECIDQVLANPRIAVDAFVLPVRDLVEAATSRAVLEMRAVHERAPWMAEFDRSWEVWADTPGGVVYSLNPLDQARLLAVGFHNLVQRATAAEIPVLLLAFPRMVEDGEYLYRALRPVLPQDVTPERAYAAHASVADRAKVRVGGELAIPSSGDERLPVQARREAIYPLPEEVDRLALRRELTRLRGELRQALEGKEQAAGIAMMLDDALAEAAALRVELAAVTERDAHRALLETERAADQATALQDLLVEAAALRSRIVAVSEGEVDRTRRHEAAVGRAAELEMQLEAERSRLTAAERACAVQTEAAHAAGVLAEQAAARAEAATVRADEIDAALATVLGSRTWRATAPVRALLGVTRRAARKPT